ncbi:MAG: GTP-binding protein [Candidatus Korarchaeota archaeon]|nr:GTP-binding protein [Candidatus Korarchaeota archaeon]NIU84529.1 GTP-binding protein [Candidatus Thorarchaeota archaeon]NIW14596.1 GTP-binding protein [Candidatus Thorarchaeota archaeon]NIW52668.1 GTP-binding protein [Candidatus Korarchaeota archaeon]
MTSIGKIIVMGDYGVGKTSIAKRLVGEGFTQFYNRTIGVDFKIKRFPISFRDQEIPVKWVIWDLAGDWTFNNITSDFFKGAKAGMFIYDIPRPDTLESLWLWANRLKKEFKDPIPVILVGNKRDWRGRADTCVPKETAKQYAQKLKDLLHANFDIPYVETSARENENISKAFTMLIDLYKEVEGSSLSA